MIRRWTEAFAVYREPRMALILVFGFSSGLPLALSFGTLSAWLAQEGIELATIGFFALVGLPYTLKFLWAPAIDGVTLPWLGPRLGRRRSWMVATQVLLAAVIVALGNADPASGLAAVALLALAVAFLSASQDIVIDAYRVEILAEREQGAGAAAIQIGYRFGMLASGAGVLYIAEYAGWPAAYGVMGLGMGVGLLAALIAREPAPPGTGADAGRRSTAPPVPMSPAAWVKDHVIAPFENFMVRPGWAAVLLFIVLYKFGDAIAGVMSNPFFIHIGFSLAEIATVVKVFGIAAVLVGAVMGGVVVARFGVLQALLWCGVLQMASNLMFAVQALVGDDLAFLAATIGIENLAGGMGTAAFVAYLSRLCNFAFTATQYALFSSLAAVGRTVLSSGGGWLAAQLDWFWFFVASAGCAVPGLVLLLWMMRTRWGFEEDGDDADRRAQGDQSP